MYGGDDEEEGGEVFHHLAVADLAVSARHPAGAGDWPGDGDVVDIDDEDGHGYSKEDEDEGGQVQDWDDDKDYGESDSPVALADLGPDVGAEPPQGSRHPDHSSKDEESKLSHLLLSRQIFSTSSHC